ncbi:RNA-directed DNA polymerase, eukaryota, reverse transcriptase zinc-binding domain protein [Tanacetum coccineum]|uniref:RNA-directed DNA polymerase, eukaryota, reverse transcriptase zinc-binding domain protein n=1 Tax=Tanacetum coccineum TaxID=301880 RepID=A0ABQ5IKN7_9ASTR
MGLNDLINWYQSHRALDLGSTRLMKVLLRLMKVLLRLMKVLLRIFESTAHYAQSTARCESTAVMFEGTASFIREGKIIMARIWRFIEEVIMKKIEYYLFDVVVEFHREMITSQLQGKLRLYDEVRARTLFVLSSSNRGRLLGIIDLMRQKNKRMKQEGLNRQIGKLQDVNPEASKWKIKKVSNYDELYMLFAKDRATFDNAEKKKEEIVNNSWDWDWKRQVLGSRNEATLEDLVLELGQVQLLDKPNSWTWILDNDDVFTVHATRVHLDSCLLHSCSPSTRWSKTLPRKVNIFVCRLSLDRLPTRLNLSLRGLDIPSIMCPMCNNVVESVDHVFFGCDLSSNVWCLVRR